MMSQGFRAGVAVFYLAVSVLFSGVGEGLADGTYYPYPFYEMYWEDATEEEKPANGAPAAELPRRRAGEPSPPFQEVPGFLFPEELGFGVAVGVPYDMFYLAGSYFTVEEGVWRRSRSYWGPWQTVPRAKLPKILLEHDLYQIRQLRNREFREYWEQKEKYQGRHFRPEASTQRRGDAKTQRPEKIKTP